MTEEAEVKQFDATDHNTWPSTTQVFEPPKLIFQNHQWVQQGYELIDSCPGCMRTGVPIPSGQMLIKEKGKYRLVDELTRK